jgi:RNA polymerase sigma factor (sigma-70 family)
VELRAVASAERGAAYRARDRRVADREVPSGGVDAGWLRHGRAVDVDLVLIAGLDQRRARHEMPGLDDWLNVQYLPSRGFRFVGVMSARPVRQPGHDRRGTIRQMSADTDDAVAPEKVRLLVENHARFLAFLRPRVGSQEVAEEILQSAFVKGIERSGTIREGETAVAWFYRLLRNALIDHYRHHDAQRRGHERYVSENPAGITELDAALEGAVCACMGDLIPTLKSEYADVLRRVELEGISVADVATELGVTPNNAAVRLHRARRALRKRLEQTCGTCTEHGCLQCTCKPGHC